MTKPVGGPGHGGPGGSGGGIQTPTIDPIRLAKQYFKVLAASVVVGLILGVGVHFIALKFFPKYTAQVTFKLNPEVEDASKAATGTIRGGQGGGAEEMERFIASQVQDLISKPVLEDAANDPKVRDETRWARSFFRSGSYDRVRAGKDLSEDVIWARAIPDTVYIVLNASTRDAADASAICTAVAEAYMARLAQDTNRQYSDTREALTRRFRQAEADKQGLERRGTRLIGDQNIESVKFEQTSAAKEVSELSEFIVAARNAMEKKQQQLSQYESSMTNPAGPSYPDFLRVEVKNDTSMQVHEQTLATLRTQLTGARARFGPAHPDVRRLEASVQAAEIERNKEEQRLLGEKFGALIELTREDIRGIEAQARDSIEKLKAASLRATEMTQQIEEYEKIKKDIERKAEEIQKLQEDLANLQAVIDRSASRRVSVYTSASRPEFPSFPKAKWVIPITAMLTIALACVGVLLREMLEQRVRAPADVLLVPRTKILGVLSDVSEDPCRPSSAEQVIRECSHGVVAEQVRQLRTSVLKVLEPKGPSVLVITSGLPGSGATSIVSNLARACASSEGKVLVIDANMRRARMHEIFGLSEGPGLGEVLAGSATLESAIQSTDRPNLKVLTAGAKSSRVYERLNSEAMTKLLQDARRTNTLVIIDAPPMTVAGDALVLAQRADASALVVRAFCETRGLIARVRGQLADAGGEFLGVIVNGVKSSAGGYFRKNIRLSHEYHGGAGEAAKLPGKTKEKAGV
ncbi:MAG: polysaccharide biosynthesis tyrosine autokinase [Phycisphaerales bacterium]